MKHIKNLLYLVAIFTITVLMVLIGTCITQIIIGNSKIVISESLLYDISGNIGVAVAAILCTVYLKKKNYIDYVGKKERFRLGKALVYGGVVTCICQILLRVVVTMLLANRFPVVEEQLSEKITYIQILVTTISAPIFEELLIRMGIYCLLRRRFSKISSCGICSITFAFIHGYHIEGFLSCLLVGVILTLIYDKTHNIIYCIFVHFICNVFAVTVEMLEERNVTLLGMPLHYEIKGYCMFHPIIILGAIAGCGIYFISVRKKRNGDIVF